MALRILLTTADWLGISSNWSFGIRVLKLAHERVFGNAPLPHKILHFEGSAYDVGMDSRRAYSNETPNPPLPTTDFALLLINTVKFHCSQLFYLFDEVSFMSQFNKVHSSPNGFVAHDELWCTHYLLVLAIGKALRFQTNNQAPSWR